MKIVVVGNKCRGAMQFSKVNGNNNFAYVSDIEDAMDAVMEHDAELIVLEGITPAPGPLATLLLKMPQRVRLLMMTNVEPYFIVVDNTLKASINYHIPTMDEENENQTNKKLEQVRRKAI